MNSGSLSTNQINSAASDTAMSAPKRERDHACPLGAERQGAIQRPPRKRSRYCGSLLSDVTCAYSGCAGGTPSGSDEYHVARAEKCRQIRGQGSGNHSAVAIRHKMRLQVRAWHS